MHKTEPSSGIDGKLDQIVEYLHRMDRRDRLRTLGGFLRGVIGLIPIVITLAGAWYLYKHGDELLLKITKQAAEQAAVMTKQGGNGFMKQIEQMLPHSR